MKNAPTFSERVRQGRNLSRAMPRADTLLLAFRRKPAVGEKRFLNLGHALPLMLSLAHCLWCVS